jgi:hypothetical protein
MPSPAITNVPLWTKSYTLTVLPTFRTPLMKDLIYTDKATFFVTSAQAERMIRRIEAKSRANQTNIYIY